MGHISGAPLTRNGAEAFIDLVVDQRPVGGIVGGIVLVDAAVRLHRLFRAKEEHVPRVTEFKNAWCFAVGVGEQNGFRDHFVRAEWIIDAADRPANDTPACLPLPTDRLVEEVDAVAVRDGARVVVSPTARRSR